MAPVMLESFCNHFDDVLGDIGVKKSPLNRLNHGRLQCANIEKQATKPQISTKNRPISPHDPRNRSEKQFYCQR